MLRQRHGADAERGFFAHYYLTRGVNDVLAEATQLRGGSLHLGSSSMQLVGHLGEHRRAGDAARDVVQRVQGNCGHSDTRNAATVTTRTQAVPRPDDIWNKPLPLLCSHAWIQRRG